MVPAGADLYLKEQDQTRIRDKNQMVPRVLGRSEYARGAVGGVKDASE